MLNRRMLFTLGCALAILIAPASLAFGQRGPVDDFDCGDYDVDFNLDGVPDYQDLNLLGSVYVEGAHVPSGFANFDLNGNRIWDFEDIDIARRCIWVLAIPDGGPAPSGVATSR